MTTSMCLSFAAHLLSNIQPTSPPCWDPTCDDRGRDDPNRGPRERKPWESQLNRPAKKGAINYAGEDDGKAESRDNSKRAGKRADHSAFPKQDVSDLASGRSDCSHDSQFARAFRHQGSQSKKNADHRDEHGDRSQDIRYGKGLIEDLK